MMMNIIRILNDHTVKLTVITVILILDQLSKWLILKSPNLRAAECLDSQYQLCGSIEVSPVIDIAVIWNRGISFGTFQSEGMARWLLVVMTMIIAIAFFIWMLRAKKLQIWLPLALIVGGAVGNLIDRIRFGAVLDFIDARDVWFPWTFNIADSAISVGAVLMLVFTIFQPAGIETESTDKSGDKASQGSKDSDGDMSSKG